MLVVPTVLSQHAEESAFLWSVRDRAALAPHYSLRTLAILESRLDGHIDGLRVAGDAGWGISRDELGWKEPGEVFAAGILAFESGDQQRIEDVLAVATQGMPLARALTSALGWLAWEVAKPPAEALLSRADPLARRAGIAAHAIHRQDPQARLERALEDESPLVRARALRAIGELGRKDLHVAAKYGLVDDDEACRFWGACSVTLLGDAIALEELRTAALAGGRFAERAALLAARAAPLRDALTWQRTLAADAKRTRIACQVAGAVGDPVLMPWLLEQMARPDVARVAGEAFTAITAIDLAYHDLEADAPAGLGSGPNDDPADTNVTLDPDEDLPFPDPRLLEDWWNRNGPAFKPGNRYLAGNTIAPPALEETLRTARQRARAAAALELVLRQPGRPLFETRAPAARQRAALGV